MNHLGRNMEDLIFSVADSNFFFNDLEECDQVIYIENKDNFDFVCCKTSQRGSLFALIDIVICNLITQNLDNQI